MSEDKTKNMKAVAAMLVCPHRWGAEKQVTLVDNDNKRRKGVLRTCEACGTHRVVYSDGTASLHSPDGLSDRPSPAPKDGTSKSGGA